MRAKSATSWVCSPSTPPVHTHPSLLHSRTPTGRLLLVSSLPSGFTFSACRPPSRDGSKNLASGKKASQVKGLAGPKLCLQVWLPLLPVTLLPHPHAANSPPPCKALASKSVPKGDRPAMHCLSSARSPRSSSPNRVISCSRLPSLCASPFPPFLDSSPPPPFFEHSMPF